MKRSKWKGPFIKTKNTNEKLRVLPRNYEVTAQVVGLVCNVHSGKKLIKLSLTDEMIGHKLGEFAPTREKFEFKKKKRK
jgi:small subunit ribosomal protein S19|uniref:Ribosomal protein S19 n=1 Tax=Tryblionella apiculata TaxID=1003145 RepID=A0A8F1B8C6_9STRA|nr:ribosomal protein S19 [Tryblionella apiculata]QWM93610.1 ribosomal protein S19 [Tryblionella apiculata]